VRRRSDHICQAKVCRDAKNSFEKGVDRPRSRFIIQGHEYQKSSGGKDVSVINEDKKTRNTRRPVRSVKLGRPERLVRGGGGPGRAMREWSPAKSLRPWRTWEGSCKKEFSSLGMEVLGRQGKPGIVMGGQ
jgi:hypothetical protein